MENIEEKTEEELAKEAKNARAREKARLQREKMKLVERQKQTVSYQKKININRQSYGLKKNKIQPKMTNFFTTIKSDTNPTESKDGTS